MKSNDYFTQLFDLQVGDKTLYDIELTLVPDGNFRYRVPDCIAPGSETVSQITIDGTIVVSRDDLHEALVEKASKLSTL